MWYYEDNSIENLAVIFLLGRIWNNSLACYRVNLEVQCRERHSADNSHHPEAG